MLARKPGSSVVNYGTDTEGKDHLVTQQGGLNEPADAQPAMETTASERATAAQCRL